LESCVCYTAGFEIAVVCRAVKHGSSGIAVRVKGVSGFSVDLANLSAKQYVPMDVVEGNQDAVDWHPMCDVFMLAHLGG
jgi:hypothetical protein